MAAEFGLTEEHTELREAARKFAQNELAASAKERARGNRIPGWMFEKMAALGYIGMTADPKYGGGGMDMTSAGVVIEELGRCDLSAAHVVITPTQFALLLALGTEEQRQKWIPPLVEGKAVYSIALTEPSCGTDISGMKTKAVRDGDYYIISGEKTPSTRGMQADGAFVFARTGTEPGARGVSCIYVPFDTPGVTRSEMPYAGMIPLNCASIFYDSVRVPVSNRIGEEGKGLSMIMQRFDVLRVLLCLVALAQAQTSLDEVSEYAKVRKTFGQPIAKHEGISFRIAEAATKIDAARLACYRTLWMCDNGMKHSKESAMCKLWAPQVAFEVIQGCITMLGHIGYSTEAPYVQRMLDVMGYQIGDGTAEAQKLTIVRELLGREFLPYT